MSTRRVVLVTGGAGFIGTNLCRTLLADPDIAEVRVLDDLSTGFETNLTGLDVQFTRGSVLDADRLDQVVQGCSHVVHLAAVPSVPRSIEDPVRSHDTNATGTLRVLEAARLHGGLHVTLASSSSVYGANPALPKSESLQTQPVSPYAVSKLAAEQYAVAYRHCYGLPVMPFRFFNVFGPLQAAGHAYAAVVPAFIEAALSGRPLVVHGDGSQTRDFTFVGTVTEVLRRAVVQSVAGDPVNLALGTRTSLLGLIDVLADSVGCQLVAEHTPPRPGDVHDSQADSARLHAMYPGLAAVSLAEGLRQTVQWARGVDAREQGAPTKVPA